MGACVRKSAGIPGAACSALPRRGYITPKPALAWALGLGPYLEEATPIDLAGRLADVTRLGLPSRVGADPGVQKPAKPVRDMTATKMSALKQLEMV